jgi:hypothetical protein
VKLSKLCETFTKLSGREREGEGKGKGEGRGIERERGRLSGRVVTNMVIFITTIYL